MDKFSINNASLEDYPAIDRLAVSAWQTLKKGYAPSAWEEMLSAVGKMSSLGKTGKLVIAESDKKIVGAVCYIPPGKSNPEYFPDNWPSIRMLVTDPDYQNMGIGRSLVEECIKQAKFDHADCIGIHTSPIMTVAYPLYQRMGFIKDMDLKPIAGAPYERLVLKF